MVSKINVVKYIWAFGLLFFFCFKSKAQSSVVKRALQADSTLGIVISAQQFDSLAKSLTIKFESDTSEKKIEDYLLLIRVCNTIEFNLLVDSSEMYKQLNDLYLFKYMRKIAELTDATISIGYSYYSKKYDIQIGGVKTKNNCFRIIH